MDDDFEQPIASTSKATDIFSAFHAPLGQAVRAQRVRNSQKQASKEIKDGMDTLDEALDYLDPETGLAVAFEGILQAA